MTDYADLIAKLAEAKEGTRGLDAEVSAALRLFLNSNPPAWVTNWAGPFVAHPDHPGFVALGHSNGELGMNWRAIPVTTSVDAILALIEKRGWRLYTVDASIPDRFSVFLKGPDRLWPATEDSDECMAPGWETGTAKTLPTALCVAMLKVSQAQEVPKTEIDYDAVHEDVQARFPNIIKRLAE